MNNKKKLTKSISVALLVALASFVSSGIVLANHFPPVGSVSEVSVTAFEQYQAAIDHAESAYPSALASSTTVVLRSSASFAPYPDEFDRSELDRRGVAITTVNRSENYVPYLDEFDRAELHWFAAKSQDDDGLLRWEQYLLFAR